MKRSKLLSLFAAVLMLFGVQSVNAGVTLTCLSGSGFGGGEGPAKLVDGTQDTKWGTWAGWYHTYEGNDDLPNAIFKAALPIAVTDYELVIANDTYNSPGRNWKSWRIFGGNFASDAEATYSETGEGWVLLDQKVDQQMTTDQFAVVPFTVSNPDGNFYSYFMIIVDAICANEAFNDYTQMDEFRFVNETVDTSAGQVYLDYEPTGVDADLIAEYATKKAALQAAYDAVDVEAIIAATGECAQLKEKIETLQNGGYIALDWTASWGDGPGSNLVDKDDYTKWGGNFPDEGEHVQYVVFRAQAQQPFFYKLVTGGDTERWNTRNWKTWKIFGGNFASEAEASRDAEGWVVLDEREEISTDYLPNKNNYPATLNFTNGVTAAYSYYKVEVYASGGSQQQMSEIYLCTPEDFEAIRQPLVEGLAEFAAGLENMQVESELEASKAEFAEKYAQLQTTTNADELTIIYNELVALKESLEYSEAFVAGGYRVLDGNTAWGDNENWTKLLDGDESTKWGGGIPEGGSYVIFKTYAASTFGVYKLVTGNDTKNSPGRNWKNWKIYGVAGKVTDETAARDLTGWTLLDEKENIGQDQLPPANFAPAFFTFSETWAKSYKYFKIEVSDAYDGGSIQMSEFRMLTDEEWQAARQEYVDALQALKDELYEGKEIAPETEATIAEAIATVGEAQPDELLAKYAAAQEAIKATVKDNFLAVYQLTEVNGVLQIATPQDLVNFARVINDGNTRTNSTFIDAALTNDIDLSKVIVDDTWTSIGVDGAPFTGVFDGQGNTISGITYTAKTNHNGLFGKIADNAVVKNFTAEGTLTVPADYGVRPIGLITTAEGENVLISNINSQLNVVSSKIAAQLGGILGGSLNGNVTVDRCVYSGIIAAEDNRNDGNYAGIVGYAQNSTSAILNISNCLFDGAVINTADAPGNCTFGGIVGYSNKAVVTIKNCLSIGYVSSAKAAQFFGAVKSTASSIINSYYQGDLVNGTASTVTLPTLEATKVTSEQLASGEIALALGEEFRQCIGEDIYPLLDKSHGIVKEISEAGYATMYMADAVKVPAGVEVSTGSLNSETKKMTLNPVDGIVPSWEPVVLKAAPGFYSFKPTECLEKTTAVNFYAMNLVDGEVLSDVTYDNVTIKFDKGEGTTEPAYYSTGEAARLYGSNTMTISATLPIIKIEFVFGAGVVADVPASADVFSEGKYNVETATWTGNAEEVTLTREAGRGHYRIISVIVTCNAGEIVNIAGNVLKGTDTDIEAVGKYVLAKPAGEPAGFYKATSGTIKAGKAYLEITDYPYVKAFFFEGDNADGIANVEKAIEKASIYNLAGQRVNSAQKGIYIVNGKKVLK